MTACAADDHLSVIATAATSDGGIESTKPSDRCATVGREKGKQFCQGRAVLDSWLIGRKYSRPCHFGGKLQRVLKTEEVLNADLPPSPALPPTNTLTEMARVARAAPPPPPERDDRHPPCIYGTPTR